MQADLKVPVYLAQPHLYEYQTTLANRKDDLYEFDNTIFHLQGGGQPNDKGWLTHGENKFDILGGSVDRETGTVLELKSRFGTNCQQMRRTFQSVPMSP